MAILGQSRFGLARYGNYELVQALSGLAVLVHQDHAAFVNSTEHPQGTVSREDVAAFTVTRTEAPRRMTVTRQEGR
jgi:hypothetical protein